MDCRTLGRLGRSRKGVTGVGVKRRIVETATMEVEREGGIAKKSEKDELGAKDYEGRSTGQTEAERMLRIILIQIGSGFANSTTAANCQISQLPSKDYECLVLDVDFQK
nr:hypothetical protein Iba_chr12eCG9170 [Ipomoea batatas]